MKGFAVGAGRLLVLMVLGLVSVPWVALSLGAAGTEREDYWLDRSPLGRWSDRISKR